MILVKSEASVVALPTICNLYGFTVLHSRYEVSHMKTGYCPKCGNACEVIFTKFVKRNGKIIYPKNRSVFVIPQCKCCKSA